MHLEKSKPIINPFGGINFVNEAIAQAGILKLIDNQLGKRAAQAMYSFSDIFMNLWNVFYCGGDCAEDLSEHLKECLQSIPGMKVCSADTVLRGLKSLKTEGEIVISSANNEYKINKNDTLNTLNISILKSLNILKDNHFYDFDYDNEVLKTEKFDTKKTYKKFNGYFPGMATTNGIPLYLENRDGNMNVKTGQAQVLDRCYNMLKNNNININRSRMDAGSYSKEIVEIVEKHSKLFYIRANRCDHLTNLLLENHNWTKIEINNIEYEVLSIEYQPFTYRKDEEPKTYRLVITRRKKENELQLDLFTKDNMEYRSILTDDRKSTEKEVVEYYNKRGAEEKQIDILNNDFGWNKMPFSIMEENTVFLIVMMICKNIFTWLIAKFAEVFSTLKEHFRLKKFIFRFITVPTKWIKRGGKMILKVFSNRPYELLVT